MKRRPSIPLQYVGEFQAEPGHDRPDCHDEKWCWWHMDTELWLELNRLPVSDSEYVQWKQRPDVRARLALTQERS